MLLILWKNYFVIILKFWYNIDNGGVIMGRKPIDIIGKTFNMLTVLAYDHTNQDGQRYYLCKCQCGKETIVRGTSLRSGNTKSCGCARRNSWEASLKKRKINLLNQKFGKLTVIEATNQSYPGGGSIWKCQCDCGNIHYTNTHELKIGRCRSCGCAKSKGEEKIMQILNDNNIPFEKEKTFDSCRFPDTNNLARFDFYVNNQYLIEFDGEQHFITSTNSSWDTHKVKQHDTFKNHWCKINRIILIRIPYTHLNDLCLADLLPNSSSYVI